ncbi:MAG: isoprenyl transferase [Hyphomicrobiaceae bacterium]|nr:isoprenyl transferase [Hyphomicrobiaceae bacterium]
MTPTDSSDPSGDAHAAPCPQHVAIIMDGNGRWAAKRHLPRAEGHRRGVEAVRRVVEAAGNEGIACLTLFSFSSENWSRPAGEVSDLMRLIRLFIRSDLARLHAKGVRVRIIGAEEGVPEDIAALIHEAESKTADNQGLILQVAFNYGARDEIVRAARRMAELALKGDVAPSAITEELFAAALDTSGIPDPDLIIRTSGEQRLSNFLLWQGAYAELVFLPVLWPDFCAEHLREAVEIFRSRDRRFGGRPEEAAPDPLAKDVPAREKHA